MILSARPIKLIHVLAFDGSRSLWSGWITHASDDRSLQKRLQMPSGNPHCIRHNSPEMVSSAHLCGSVSTASPLSSVVSPSRPSVGPFTPRFNSRHRTVMLPLRRARRIHSFLCARAPHSPFSLPPSLPPSAHHAGRAAPTFLFCLDVFHVLPRSPPQPQPGCSLISFLFLEASTGLRCGPPPACGGAPGAVRVCLPDHCFVLRTIRQRRKYQMGTDNGDAKIGEEKRKQRQLAKRRRTKRRGGQKS